MSDLSLYKDCSFEDINELVKKFSPNVKRIVYHMLGRLPRNVETDDLIQAGMMGLLEAAKQYDPSKGASFETYAGIRVRGAVLDDVRKRDWYPRSIYKQNREVTEAIKKVESVTKRDAKPQEIAKMMGTSLEEYHSILRDINSGQIYHFDDLGLPQESIMIEENDSENPLTHVTTQEHYKHISEVIDSLPEKEKVILSLYYNEEMNLKEIGAVMEISESRVCQIRSQALLRVKSRLRNINE